MFSKITRFVAIIATVLTIQSCSKSSDSTSTPTPASPVASFNYSGANTFAPDIVSFTNTSTNSLTYLWNFGDNSTSNSVSPQHTYASGGTYTVSLTSTSLSGVSNSTSLTINVSNAPTKLELDTVALYSTGTAPSTTSYNAYIKVVQTTTSNVLVKTGNYSLMYGNAYNLTVTSGSFCTFTDISSDLNGVYEIQVWQPGIFSDTELGYVSFEPSLNATFPGLPNYPTSIPINYNGTSMTLKVKWLP